MSQKILKLILLLMIGVVMCVIPMLGFYPMAESYYAALCSIQYISFAAWPLMIFTIFNYGGVLAAMKYGTMMATTGLCVSQYRKGASKFNPYVAAIIVSVVTIALEGIDWVMNGMVTRELYGLIPIVMLTWSTTIIFTYFVKKIMFYFPRDKNASGDYKRQEIAKNEGMIRTSEAFKNLATEIKKMSAMESSQELTMEGTIEREIEGNICRGCENGQIQYLERARLNYLWYNKMLETREAMAIQLNEMANLLEYYTKPMYDDKKVLFGMDDYLRHKLRERKIITRKISISENGKGRLEVRVTAKKKKRSDIKIEMMESVVTEAVGRKMRASKENLMDVTCEYNQFCFFEEVNFLTISGTARRTREDEDCSGDNFTVMEMNTGQTFMSICDGMGSGKKARQYSEMVIDMLERLLESGFSESTSLKLINSILLTGNQWQEPAAVDMALIDQYSGICQFLKLGAACTYIKRGNWVECIKSTSLPMGVFEEVDVETITKKLYDGDFVVMISDGIVDALQCEDKEEAMGRLIMEINTSSPREMALHILSKALAMTDGVPKDDMTVLCTGIWEKIQ
ncbi:SpoIIE family protein phosphatase [uncultured Eubacterium sp.]|uniref:SpoIIE family protein phosphatase n=1 Tax=uncultured Eubacterium sp. TaxID=165185 RepID=UPI0026721BF1|nr:SpoIIE family protein phosphatase [uncultured Eubacterium sp.]